MKSKGTNKGFDSPTDYIGKYMVQDSSGNWTRKKGMWNDDNTPKTAQQLIDDK